jgi:hypothetical protein
VPARSCRISLVDSERIEHAVGVVAASLYEAAVMAMAEFRRCGFADATFVPATRLTVRVKAPEEEHTVAVAKIRSWLDGGAKSPNEKVEKQRLKQLLGA